MLPILFKKIKITCFLTKTIPFKGFLIGSFFFLHCFILPAQNQYKKESEQFRKELNESFKNPETSILLAEDFKEFKGLKFYPIDEKFIVSAKFIRTPDEEPFKMPTTTERLPEYIKYGELHFYILDKSIKLSVYQEINLRNKAGFEDYLFLPFTDLTNGEETYGGGRYLDLRIPQKEKVIINFNNAYNPYCAYNPKYSCPIPPETNDIPLRIEAGVKAFHP